MKDYIDVLLVQPAAVEGYPPTINQANLLTESGLRVGILDMWHPDLEDRNILHPNIKRWSPIRQWLSYKEPSPPLWLRLIRRQVFKWKLSIIRRRFHPKIEIGYDAIGCWYLGSPAKNKAAVIWHLHEYPAHQFSAISRGIRIAHNFLKEYSDGAELIVVPDTGRAQAMLDEGIVKKIPTVVMNCPRRLENLPENYLKIQLKQRDLSLEQIVLYQGAVSDTQYTDIIIKSMPLWTTNSILVFLGPVRESWKKQIFELTENYSDNIIKRICMLEPVKYKRLFNYTVGAHIGLGLIRPLDNNWKYSAGAVNKRFEYMACQIPQIANTGYGMHELIENTNAGLCVDAESPEAVGKAIRYLLENKDERFHMGKKAREAHLEKYNYEVQFEPVCRYIMEMINR